MMHGRAKSITMSAVAALVICGCGPFGGKSDPGASLPTSIDIMLTEQGCEPVHLEARSGVVSFNLKNQNAKDVTLFQILDIGTIVNQNPLIVGETNNISTGVSHTYSLALQPGSYVINCPGPYSFANGTLTVKGARIPLKKTPAALIRRSVAAYHTYVQREANQLLAGTRTFVKALEAGDLQRAETLYGPTRFHYEAIEPVSESFPALDTDIDARIDNVASLLLFHGFHEIEQILWTKHTTNGTAAPGRRLLANVLTLKRKIRTLRFTTTQIANGAVTLLNEVAVSKITGEEDRYSHTDLSDFEANLTGSRMAYMALRPILIYRGQQQLAGIISARFASVQKGLDRYRRNTPLGLALYTALKPEDRLSLARKVDALAEPLSNVAEQVKG